MRVLIGVEAKAPLMVWLGKGKKVKAGYVLDLSNAINGRTVY